MKEVLLNTAPSSRVNAEDRGRSLKRSTDIGNNFASLLKSGSEGGTVRKQSDQNFGKEADAARRREADLPEDKSSAGNASDEKAVDAAAVQKSSGNEARSEKDGKQPEEDALQGQSAQELQILFTFLNAQGADGAGAMIMADFKEEGLGVPGMDGLQAVEEQVSDALTLDDFSENGEKMASVPFFETDLENAAALSDGDAGKLQADFRTGGVVVQGDPSGNAALRGSSEDVLDVEAVLTNPAGTGEFIDSFGKGAFADGAASGDASQSPEFSTGRAVESTGGTLNNEEGIKSAGASAPMESNISSIREAALTHDGGRPEGMGETGAERDAAENGFIGTEKDISEGPDKDGLSAYRAMDDGRRNAQGVSRAKAASSGREDSSSDVEKLAGHAAGGSSVQNVFTNGSMRVHSERTVLPTSEAKLPEDLANMIADRGIGRRGELVIELEPRNLGQITIRLNYEGGRASLMILSSNPKTLELLSERAEDMARILSQKTGNDTEVQLPQRNEGGHQMNWQEQQGRGDSENRRHADQAFQDRNRERQHQDRSESFLQQMRLGLV